MKAIQLRADIPELRKVIIDEMELTILTDVFQRCTGRLGCSYFTRYIRAHVHVLKNQFSLVHCSQICKIQD